MAAVGELAAGGFLMIYFFEDRLHGAGGAQGQAAMQSRLWSRLPPELLERVLLFLPSSVQARLQHVCKAWRSLLASTRFQEKSTRVALACRRNTLCYRKPHGYLLQRHHLSLHNVRVDLSFVPDRFRTGYRDWRDQRSWFGGRATRVSLLCLSESGIPEVSGVHGSIYSVRLCVVDLARRTCMELPPVDLPAERSVGFDSGELTEEESGVFRITLLSAITEKATPWVASYSSRVGTWNVGNLQPRLVMSSGVGYLGMVMCKDSSICIVHSDDMDNEATTYKVEISGINSLWASRQWLSLETVTIAHLIMDGFHDSQFKPNSKIMQWFLFEYNGDLLWIRHDHVWWAGDDSYNGDDSDDPDTDTVGRVSIWVMKKSKGNEQVLVRPQWLSGIVVAKASSVTSWLANDTILLTFTSSRAGEDMVFAYHLQQISSAFL